MLKVPDSRLAVKLSGPEMIDYSYLEEIQNLLYSQVFFGTAIGAKVHKDKFSLFTYSLLADEPIFRKDGFVSVDGNWTFRFASAYRDLLSILENYLNCKTVELLKGKTFEIKGVYKEPLMERNIFQTLPILVINRDKNFVSPDKDEFYVAIREGLYNRYEFYNGTRPNDNSIKSINFTQRPRKKLIAYKNRNLLSFAGSIKITGDQEVIKFAQCTGLGQLPSAGMGMLI